jgi:photosystem II stability/assembly factor-like uncharacterized protein
MKRLVVALVFSLQFVAPAVASASPDSWTTGLSGKSIFAVVVDPSNPKIVYAGEERGILKSTDGGTTWMFLKVGSPDVSRVYHLAIDPQHPHFLYASTGSEFGGGYLFKSTDGGETWSLIHPGRRPSCIHTPQSPRVLVIDPHHPEVVYTGVSNLGFLKSIDGGSTWTMLGMCPGCTAWHIDVTALVLDPTNPAVFYAGDLGGGVLKFDIEADTARTILEAGDNGAEDGRDLRIYSINDIAVAPTQPTTLYVSTQGRGILKISDRGAEWQELAHEVVGWNVFAVAIDPTAPATLYAATYDSVFMSTDSGGHWQNLQFPSSTPGINAITVNPTGTVLYVGSDHGMFMYRLGK